MKFLVDASLSPKLANILSSAGHDAVHLRDRAMQSAEDPEVLALAEAEARVVVSADTDFGTLLMLGARRGPSVILFRGNFQPTAPEQARTLLSALPEVSTDLDKGAILVITRTRLRIREL